ncbi:helix-turn-helix transcriptional regulator [Bacteroides uniformis]|jgi:DNA-binding XRE family transcriptional regulator|uniref:helix-turn-helix domain-containing protein n=2 Tax=Bacteroides TaxID=816 RepID=UPI001CCA315E|nr:MULTISPECIES: helix-turn-helix transcriptional regulator [Bacteroides]MCE9019722.1 helix-turn-helix transcriptional regulator [Bacteroides thetaiotaomicron]UBD15675.1 helix-turn-helix transcriptional regulator [Bacteroides salyersiae]
MEKKSAISERIQMLITEFCDGKNLPFAKAIGINESNIRSYIAGTQPRFDVLAAIADKFAVNCEWLLTGRGEMTKTNQSTPVEHMQTGYVSKNKDKEKIDNSQGTSPEIFDKLLSTIKEQQITIKEQAEEIGILKQTIVQLKQESAGRVSGAESSTLAGVG